MVRRLIILLVAFVPASPAGAGNVLVAGSGTQNGTIQTHLENLGHAVTRSTSDTLPADISPFDTVWVHTLAALSAGDIDKLSAFVEVGGGVYLNGEDPAVPNPSANGEALVNATVTGGASITVGAPACTFSGNASPNLSAVYGLTTRPYSPTRMEFAAAGCIAGAATANHVATAAGSVIAAAWGDADMVGGRGRIAIVMDADWPDLDDAWIDEWVANLQHFLQGILFADGFEPGPSYLQCNSPADGAEVDLVPGADVVVQGSALGLSDIRVNGAPVAVAADGTFSATVTGHYGVNFVELSGTDDAGATRTAQCAFLGAEHWVSGTIAGDPEGVYFTDALMFRVERPGFDKLKSILPALISGPSAQRVVTALAGAIGQTELGACGGFGTCADVQYRSSSIVIDIPFLRFVVNEATETFTAEVQLDVRLRLRVASEVFGTPRPTVEGDVVFNNVFVSISVGLDVDATTGLPSIGLEDVSNINLSGADWSQFAALDSQIRNMVVSFVNEEVSETLASELPSGPVELFEGLFATGMDVTLPAAGFPVGRLDGTSSVTVALKRWHSLDLRNNGLSLGTALRVIAPPLDTTSRVPLPPPVILEDVPRPADVYSAAHVGVFNQVLQALWHAGAFDGTVDGAALGPGLPAGTSLSVQLGLMPVVTGFGSSNRAGLDVGALHLVVTHPALPPGLRVAVGARIDARATLLAEDLVFDDITVNERHVSTGAVTLDAASRATLHDLIDRLLLKMAGVALNDSLPVLPATVITTPPSLGPYGFTVGRRLGGAPSLAIGLDHLFLDGYIGAF